MLRNLPLHSSSALLHAYQVAPDACENFLAVPDMDRVNIYDVGHVTNAAQLRFMRPVFTTQCIPVKNTLLNFARMACIALQPDYLWAGMQDGMVRVWNWHTKQGMRTCLVHPAQPTAMYKVDKDVMVMWSSHTLVRYTIDPAGRLQTVLVTQTFPPLIYQALGGFELKISKKSFTLNGTTKGALMQYGEELKYTAATMVLLDGLMHLYVTMQRPQPDALTTLLVHYKLTDVTEERLHTKMLLNSTVATMATFSEKLAVGMYTKNHAIVIIYCAHTMTQRFFLNLEQYMTKINFTVLNAKGSNERLMILSGDVYTDLVGYKWMDHRHQMCCMIAAARKDHSFYLPAELLRLCLEFL